MSPEDFEDWKRNEVTQHQLDLLAEGRQDCMEMLATILLKSNDKEIGYRAGWVDCLAAIRTMLETAEVSHTTVDSPKAKPVVVSFEEHLAKRIG